jgi:hypothetical protein
MMIDALVVPLTIPKDDPKHGANGQNSDDKKPEEQAPSKRRGKKRGQATEPAPPDANAVPEKSEATVQAPSAQAQTAENTAANGQEAPAEDGKKVSKERRRPRKSAS